MVRRCSSSSLVASAVGGFSWRIEAGFGLGGVGCSLGVEGSVGFAGSGFWVSGVCVFGGSNLMTLRRLSTFSALGVGGISGGFPAVAVSVVATGSSFPSLSLMCTPPITNLCLGDPSHINRNPLFILLCKVFLEEEQRVGECSIHKEYIDRILRKKDSLVDCDKTF